MTAEQSGTEWIQRANARPIGQIEFRQVAMEIGSKRGSRLLQIRTLRESDGVIARTVFCVMQPWALSNINYVVTEHLGRVEPFSIQLYLPYVLGTLRDLPSDRRREGYLGSDFSYDDLRTWLYEEGHRYQDMGVNGSMTLVRGVCVDRAHLVRHGVAPFDVWLDRENNFVRGVDFWSSDGSTVVRQYRADEVTVIDGIAIAKRMAMVDRARNHTTTIRLERAWYDRPIDANVFDASFRSQTRDYLATL